MQKSYMVKGNSLKKNWYLFDAENQVMGRLAVTIANILMGKHRPWYTPHIDTGDFVIITNVEKMKITGKKREEKVYYTWSYYPGGLKQHNMGDMMQQHPDRLLYMAVRRMMPKSPMGRKMMRKLKIYRGSKHPHTAQCPTVWKGDEKVTLKEVLVNG